MSDVERMRKIVGEVAADYCLSVEDLQSRSMAGWVKEARRKAAYRLCFETPFTLAAIGQFLGNRDSSTISKLIQRAERTVSVPQATEYGRPSTSTLSSNGRGRVIGTE